MARRFTGIKPTGHLHLGNYLGALRPTVASQLEHDTLCCVVDLHALTVEHSPTRHRQLTRELATLLLAAGLEPELSTVFVQSQVSAHTELHYLLECVASYGQAHRMIQFKEKASDAEGTRLSLLTYPVLMAADVLAYDTQQVPVGEDQRQHVELARDVAVRFNARYGETLTVPALELPERGARVKDLLEPTRKMGKTGSSGAGIVYALDPPEVIARKIARAVTDSEGEVRYDAQAKPGVSNLLDILAACEGGEPTAIAGGFTNYGELKRAVTDTVVETLRPLRTRYAALTEQPEKVDASLRRGAEEASRRAAPVLARVRRAMGLPG